MKLIKKERTIPYLYSCGWLAYWKGRCRGGRDRLIGKRKMKRQEKVLEELLEKLQKELERLQKVLR